MGWSRRIVEGQPLVYRLNGELHVILACRYHGRWGSTTGPARRASLCMQPCDWPAAAGL